MDNLHRSYRSIESVTYCLSFVKHQKVMCFSMENSNLDVAICNIKANNIIEGRGV
ncbi:MAG: hypothetical protein AABX51_06650 [Nanoarchaeota archaeon]